MKILNKKMVCIKGWKETIKSIFYFNPDAKENNRDTNSTNDSSIEPDNPMDMNNHLNMGSQKFRRREYHHHHLGPPRLNSTGGPQDKRNKHELRRKRRHSGEERDDRNRKSYKVCI
jgi:hypothetical protein